MLKLDVLKFYLVLSILRLGLFLVCSRFLAFYINIHQWSRTTEVHTSVAKGDPVRCHGDRRGLVPTDDVIRLDRTKNLREVDEFGFSCEVRFLTVQLDSMSFGYLSKFTTFGKNCQNKKFSLIFS